MQASGPNQRPDGWPQAGEIRHVQGATVVVDPGHDVQGAAIHLTCPASDDSGAGHLLEHMVFRDPAVGQGGDLYAALMSSGPLCDLNASTLATHTTYHLISATPEGRDAMLVRMLRAILHPALDPVHLAEERAIVASEMAGFWASPQAAALEGLRALAFPDQRAAQGGLPEAVRRLEVADLCRLHRRHYRPGGLLLHVTGTAPDPDFWRALEMVLPDGPSALPPARVEPGPQQALPMALPPDRGVPGLAWLLPGLGPRAVEVLRAAVEMRVPGASGRSGVESGTAEMRLAGPVLAVAEAEQWLAKVSEGSAGPDLATALQAQARLALLRGATLVDRRAALVQAWRTGADLMAALATDETPRLQAWAEGRPTDLAQLAGLLRRPVAAHVFHASRGLTGVPRRPPPATLSSPRPARRTPDPELSVLSLADLPQADLHVAGALLRGLAAREGVLVVPMVPGPWIALAALQSGGGLLQGDAPPLTPPAPLPLHLRIERRLWAALTPEGAALAGLDGEAAPSAAGRIWRDLCARGLSPELTPQPLAPRETLPVAQSEQRMPGTLSTLGLGLVLEREPLLPLIAHALEWHWLRETVRRAGGAYGVRCRVGPGGALVFLAARDPAQPEATLARFAESGDWLRHHLRGDLLDGAIRGTLERLAPQPAARWERRLAEWRARLASDQAPDRLRDAVAGASAREVAAFADSLDQAMARAVQMVHRASG